ncbi:MAG: aminotransferase class V-fold PLP-dependent enzyme [Lachnospiraceae bacterium]|nr:aminotransferase class V-fold PLP-dependent enzyme [Lachnospiraceae bacterium]
MIYLDNAATTVTKPEAVVQAVSDALRSFGNAGRGVHESSLLATRAIHETRIAAADFFHAADPACVAFTSNATEALNTAIKGILSPGDHVITTASEHNSVLRPLYETEARGVSLTILPVDAYGNISFDDLASALKKKTKAVICSGASNVTGNLRDVRGIAAAAHARDALFVLDAAQIAGCHPVDLQSDGIDILCFTGHKSLFGPQGTGGIIVREGLALRPLKSGGSGMQSFSKTHPEQMPAALEAGTLNGHGLAGLHAAFCFLKETGQDNIRHQALALAKRFFEGVKDIPDIRFYGDYSDWDARCPIVALNLGEEDAALVSDTLSADYGIATGAGAHCAPLMHEALGTVTQGIVRFSFSFFNTEAETDAAILALRNIATARRQEARP